MPKLIVVFNTCGLGGQDNTDFYIHAINNILAQRFDDFKVVLSACMNSQACINRIYGEFGNLISYNIINEVLPLSVTFNHSCQKMVEAHGECDGFVYLDSGMLLQDENVLQKLYDTFKNGNYGLVSTQASNDMGLHLWFGVGSFHGDDSQNHLLFEKDWVDANGYKLDEAGNFIMPPGKCTNLHINLWSWEFYKTYNDKILSDILASYCLESYFSFMVAAIQKQWVITKDITAFHAAALDGAALGYAKRHDMVFRSPKSITEIITPGHEYGFGYDESRGVLIHKPECFDENYLCINDQLKEFIRDNLFLSKEYMDYDTVRHQFVK